MFKQAKPLFLIVETPLHAGSGNDLGIVDLPIQREKHTDYPKIEASGLKGSIREIFDAQGNKSEIELVFGPEQGDLHAGALGFTDARLLLFPVKSVKGVFAYVTCPAVLEGFKYDLSICQPNIVYNHDRPGSDTVTTGCELIVKDSKIVLEEYTFEVSKNKKCDAVAEWIAKHVLPPDSGYDYWRDKVKRSLVVLRDDDFRDFVTLSTEVIARTKIDSKTGTVDKKIGGLWYEEYLPTDSILYSLALTTPIFKENDADKGKFQLNDEDKKKKLDESEKVMDFFVKGLPNVIQIGGNATIGKGIVRTHVYKNGGANNATNSNNA